ncbi:MAG: fused MFS/spermidine synthase [Pseudomonadales bacterium]|nr:fused MFS/spermidine synthase [Pseudomonadales bacterium]MCP5184843.1 fused MFS/spermidine synthase [Pseudomonadales bacterium]
MKQLVLCLIGALFSGAAHGKVLHQERSLYQNVLVVENGRERCLQFSVKRDLRNQSCIRTDHPEEMVFSYTRMMMAALLLRDAPASILVVGLGGGTLPGALQTLFPAARLDVVEIDPAVVRVARDYFGFIEAGNTTVHTMDARVFGRRARAQARQYDLILLDAYNGEYIPEHLLTREYLEETRNLLNHGGVLAANTFAISHLYDHESTTYEAVFGQFLNFRLEETANRVILVARDGLPTADFRAARADELQPRVARFGIRLNDYLGALEGIRDWDADARVLTDQYAPANLLNR